MDPREGHNFMVAAKPMDWSNGGIRGWGTTFGCLTV